MKTVGLALVALIALSFCGKFVHADDANKSEKITGVLIDDHCAGKMMKKDDPQAAAEAHPVSCANKCIEGGASVVLITGKDEMKLDEKGEKMAKEYLAKADAKSKVTVTGEKDGDMIKVTSIDAAE